MDIKSCRTQPDYAVFAAIADKAADAAVVIYRNQAVDLELNSEDVSSVNFSAAGGLVVTGTALSGEPSASAVNGYFRCRTCRLSSDYGSGYRLAPGKRHKMPPAAWFQNWPGRILLLVMMMVPCYAAGQDKAFGCAQLRSGWWCIKWASRAAGHSIRAAKWRQYPPVTLAKPFGAGDAFLVMFLQTGI